MSARAFLDSNVLIYTFDERCKTKYEQSRQLLRELVSAKTAVISTQVLQECFAVAIRKLNIPPLDAKAIVVSFSEMEVIQLTPEIIFDAMDGVMLERISFWDSLLISAAKAANCATIYTEDLQHGQTVRGVRICNPFA